MWIKKCVKYFELCKIPQDQKVDLASLYMIDKAEKWVTSYLYVPRVITWEDLLLT